MIGFPVLSSEADEMTRAVVVCTLLLATAAVAQKQTELPRMALWWLNRSTRIDHATKMLDEFAQLGRQIPTLSPEEEKWLKEDDDTIAANGGRYTQRALRATETQAWDV